MNVLLLVLVLVLFLIVIVAVGGTGGVDGDLSPERRAALRGAQPAVPLLGDQRRGAAQGGHQDLRAAFALAGPGLLPARLLPSHAPPRHSRALRLHGLGEPPRGARAAPRGLAAGPHRLPHGRRRGESITN